jgi:hypothetical protein
MPNATSKPYRGSEWRKWDLQIHCPADVLNNQFEGSTEDEKWEKYIGRLEQTDLEAIAVTNYFCADGYEKVLEYKRKGRLENIGLILPNIEFRLSQPNRSGEYTNIHVIFSDSVEIAKIQNFLARLKIISTDEDSKDQFCTPENLQQIGYDKALVEFSELRKKLEDNFVPRRNYLIAGVARGYGAFRPAQNEGRGAALAIEIDKISDLFFGKSADVSHFLDTSRFSKAKQKPVARTSDAHELDKIGTEFTWIKADCTFDGLKQIIYEPSARVCLEDNAPLYSHPQIVSAKLLNASGYQSPKSEFPPITLTQEIFFSPNLSTIIGPRAAGKTVLVELIGYVANQFSTDKKDNKLPLVEFLSKEFADLEVEIDFQSGAEEVTTLKRPVKDWNDPFYTSPFKVEYWTQGDIERKADSPKQIADYIGDRLHSDLLIKTKEEIEALREEMETLRSSYSDKLQTEIEKRKLEAERKQIEAYFNKLKTTEYKEITGKIKENRAKRQLIESLVQDIENQTSLLKNLASQLSFSSTVDKDKVLELFGARDPLRKKIEGFYQLKETQLDTLVADLETTVKGIKNSAVKKALDKENTDLAKQFTDYCKSNGITITKGEVEKRNNRIKFIDQQVSKLENQLKKFEGDKKRHSQLATELTAKLKLWGKENGKLIKEFNKSFESTEISAFWNDPASEIAEWIKAQFLQSNSELKGTVEKNFKIKSPVRENYLEDIINELVAKYGEKAGEKIAAVLKQNKAPELQDSSGKTETIRWFFEDKSTEPIREDIIMRLSEYAETGDNYIKYGDKILGKDSMSFGERCGTLVELILLSGDHPLIIDQPEDHLDAKFVAERVVTLIREQKPNRQVIICTHNANIVVLGDSELVTALSVNSRDEVNAEQGSLENIQMRKTIFDVLEGGETAFKKREQKYGEAIS